MRLETDKPRRYALDAVQLLRLRFHYPRNWTKEDPYYWLTANCDVHPEFGKSSLSPSGMGGYTSWVARGLYTDVDLPVLCDRDYWVNATRWSAGPNLDVPANNGPFRPDGKRHFVRLELLESKDLAGWNPCGGFIPYDPRGVISLAGESAVEDGLLIGGFSLVG